MPDTPTDAEREAFEALHLAEFKFLPYRDPEDGTYHDNRQAMFFRFYLAARRTADAEVRVCDGLIDLVRHAWLHSGYKDCGRQQMDSDQRRIYDAVIQTVTSDSMIEATAQQRFAVLAKQLPEPQDAE